MPNITTLPDPQELRRHIALLDEFLQDLARPLNVALATYVRLVDESIAFCDATGIADLDFDEQLHLCGLQHVNDLTETVLGIDREINAVLTR